MVRWHYLDPWLLWLYPLAFLAHLVEESFAGEGLRVWLSRFSGRPISTTGFVAINAVAMALMIVGVAIVTRRQSGGWLAIALGTLVLLNSTLHLLGTLVTQSYSPGLITAFVLYLPLGLLTLLRAQTQATAAEWRLGALAGAGAQILVSTVALSGLL